VSDFSLFGGFSHILSEVALALLPLIVLFLIFQFTMLKLDKQKVKTIFIGLAFTFIGLSLFLQGVYAGFLPIGQMTGRALGELRFNWIIVPIGLVLGFVATFAEPAVRVLNYEVEKASGGYIPQKLMLYTLSIGVGLAIALSMIRVLYGIPLWFFVIPGYLAALALMPFTKKSFIGIAFDSGGVATGPMTVTFIVAVAIGFTTALEDRNPLVDGFGMVALVALAPILAVLILGLLYKQKEKENIPS
jgi:hypothetical protein